MKYRTRKPALSSNVFLRSTLRQPVKTALLLVVLALITFAFVARAAEYLLVRQETERLGSYYRAVGTLTSGWQDTSEAAAYLEARKDVDVVNVYRYVSGVLGDFCNADTKLDGPSNYNNIMIFYGILNAWDEWTFYFTVDEVVSGYPEYIKEGRLVGVRQLWVTPDDLDSAYAGLETGARYLVMGDYVEAGGFSAVGDNYTNMYFWPLADDSFFLPAPKGQALDWETVGVKDVKEYQTAALRLAADDQHSLNMIATVDMSVLPEIQQGDPDIYLADGRWLDAEDNTQANKVCVINAALASAHHLTVGDRINIKLRDIPCGNLGYFYSSEEELEKMFDYAETGMDAYEIVGIYDYLIPNRKSFLANNTYIPASVVPDSFINLGISAVKEEHWDIPSSVIQPDTISFTLTSPDGATQFLVDARSDLEDMGFEVQFLDDNWDTFQAATRPMRQSALLNVFIFVMVLLVTIFLLTVIYYRMRRKDIAIARALGVSASRCAQEVSVPLVLLGILGISVGCWLGWVYTLRNAVNILAPLSGLGEDVMITLPVLWLAVLGGGVLVLLILVTAAGAIFLSSCPVLTLMQGGTPQNKATNGASVTAAAVSPNIPVASTTPASFHTVEAPAQRRGAGFAHILRFVWRHITRSKLRTALSILLAAGFTVGLAVIQLSIRGSQEQINWLYENTFVEAELVQADTSQNTNNSGFLRRSTLDSLLESGYVTNAYVEGSTTGVLIHYTSDMAEGTAIYVSEEDVICETTILGFADEAVFLSTAGSGGTMEVTYFDGWDGSLFAQEWPENDFPVVISKELYDELGDRIGLSCKGFRECEVAGYYEGKATGEAVPILVPLGAYQALGGSRNAYSKAHVTLDPSLNRELDRFTDFLKELSATQGVGSAALRAVFWDEELRTAVAPLENSVELMRVLYPVTLVLSMLVAAGITSACKDRKHIGTKRNVKLRAGPCFFQRYFPIFFGRSNITALFIMTSAKEAAIMRVLGTSKMKSRVMLALQTIFTSAAGLLIGVCGILAYIERTRPDLFTNLTGASVLCAMLYLLAAIIGSAVSASIVTSKNPLELLQVKE